VRACTNDERVREGGDFGDVEDFDVGGLFGLSGADGNQPGGGVFGFGCGGCGWCEVFPGIGSCQSGVSPVQSYYAMPATRGGRLPLAGSRVCPSSRRRDACLVIPPGNLGFSEPSSFTTRQYGVTRAAPARAVSSAASAAMRTKIPVVSGQVQSA